MIVVIAYHGDQEACVDSATEKQSTDKRKFECADPVLVRLRTGQEGFYSMPGTPNTRCQISLKAKN